jgi:hypothetical protein
MKSLQVQEQRKTNLRQSRKFWTTTSRVIHPSQWPAASALHLLRLARREEVIYEQQHTSVHRPKDKVGQRQANGARQDVYWHSPV